jgi:SPP1 family predicted phage head-tail adaptor
MGGNAVRGGDFNRRIAIQQRSSGTPDSFGQASQTWTDLLQCWARIEPLSGRELVLAQAQSAEVTHLVEIMYRPTVTAAMRVVYQGRIFNVLSVIDPDMAHVTLELLCSEGLNKG